MRTLRGKIISGTVKIDGHKKNGIETVLLAVGLSLDQEHFLGQPIRGVRLFRIAIPQVLLPERQRRELGIAADRAQGDEFLDLAQKGFMQELDAHNGIVFPF